MSVVFTADDEPAAAQQEYWRYVLRQVLGPVEPRGGLPDRLLLDRCRRDLLLESTAPVSAIGARWGLTNASHFSRLFRGAYGIAPGDYRRLTAGANRLPGRE